MKKLSLYNEIFGEIKGSTEKLGAKASENKLSSFSLKFETKIPNLEKMCYIMEKVILNKGEDAKVYAGFQKLSRVKLFGIDIIKWQIMQIKFMSLEKMMLI